MLPLENLGTVCFLFATVAVSLAVSIHEHDGHQTLHDGIRRAYA